MRLTMLKSKLHGAQVTGADLHYEGSIAIDPDLVKKANMREFERVDVYNVTNGARFSTYIILGKKGEFCLNGACARLAQVGDQIIVATYAEYEEHELKSHKPRVVILGNGNKIKK